MLGMYTAGAYYMGEVGVWAKLKIRVSEAFHGSAIAGKATSRTQGQELAQAASMGKSGKKGMARQHVAGRSDAKRLRHSGRQTTRVDILTMSESSADPRSGTKEAADKSLESRE